ncbi:hypothetical protein J3D55_000410 [Chryseobacterium ginsenosidimutans]|uniref:hypothetical protein n=1 Tax=Chryseobacterium ginsenosidimutans TaxID=687846 RepID=UPI00216A71CF|nr:hypothetical protein [Chryseobacterium ginsenosidimutans]MCS3867494.1 hypothetical protein [Chryseobacterium ginsenosidimutans]
MKKIYVSGNGNLSWENFHQFYIEPLKKLNLSECEFIIRDFSGTDTLMMEFLKDKSENVTILHVGQRPRYLINKFKTKAEKWNVIGGFTSNYERDLFGIELCTHFLAIDFNTDENRKSGTLKNIEKCLNLNKIKIK